MVGKNQYITIKGTRDGLTLFLDDACSFDDLMNELDQILSYDQLDVDDSLVRMNIQLGYRYLHKEQEEALRELIRKRKKLVIHEIESNLILKEDALKLKEESDVRVVAKTVRSGQELDITGDLLLVGDVNPGGTVKATGNVFVMGKLKGIAHAGYKGNENAVIAASYMNPMQLRIADRYSRSPDYETDGVYLECGYIDQSNKIIIDRLQVVAKNRPELNEFERSVLNG